MNQSSDKLQIDKLGVVKNWLEDNQKNIVLILGIILIALISFGMGRLTAVHKSQPVVIETGDSKNDFKIESQEPTINNDTQTANMSATINDAMHKDSISLTQDQQQLQTPLQKEKGIIVASRNGKKYHWPWCSWAKKIKPENQVWFKSEEEAQKAGYQPCAAFHKLAPANYKPQ